LIPEYEGSAFLRNSVTTQNNGILNYTAAKIAKYESNCGFPLYIPENANMAYQLGHDGLLPNLIQIY
jgi:hypothetical protein